MGKSTTKLDCRHESSFTFNQISFNAWKIVAIRLTFNGVTIRVPLVLLSFCIEQLISYATAFEGVAFYNTRNWSWISFPTDVAHFFLISAPRKVPIMDAVLDDVCLVSFVPDISYEVSAHTSIRTCVL